MVQALHYLIEFCYLVHQDFHMTTMLEQLERTLDNFHNALEIFLKTGVWDEGSVPPQQHSLIHYPHLIHKFGLPNGLCSSITKSKHIQAVKEPWWQSNWWKVLFQMLIMNLHLDKLAASETLFKSKQLLEGDVLSYVIALCKCYEVFKFLSRLMLYW